MNEFLELLRRMQAPAVDTETGFYDTYQPKVKQVITETDDDQPNKRVTTIDYPQVDTREIGSLSMGPLSMMSAERRGYDPMLMQSEEKIPMDQLYTDTIGDTGMTSDQIISQASQDPTLQGLVEGAMPAGVAGTVARAAPKAIGRVEKFLADRGYMQGRYPGATRKGEMIFGKDAAGRSIRKVAEYPGQFRQPPALTGKGRAAIGLGIGGGMLASGGELLNIPGIGISTSAISDALKSVKPSESASEIYIEDATPKDATQEDAQQDQSSAPAQTNALLSSAGDIAADPLNLVGQVRSDQEQIDDKPALESMYGKYARDPKARKQQYLDQISKIYRNAMILNAIAELTGGRSQAGMYVKMATGKLDAIEKFDQEERMHAIFKDVFIDENGQFRQGFDYYSARDRILEIGGSVEEANELAASIFGKPTAPKEPGTAGERAEKIAAEYLARGNRQAAVEVMARFYMRKENALGRIINDEESRERAEEYVRSLETGMEPNPDLPITGTSGRNAKMITGMKRIDERVD